MVLSWRFLWVSSLLGSWRSLVLDFLRLFGLFSDLGSLTVFFFGTIFVFVMSGENIIVCFNGKNYLS